MVGRLPRSLVAAAGVVALAVVAVLVLVLVFARGWWSGSGGSYAPRALVASGSVLPHVSLFGDPLTAHARVLVDARRVRPASVRLYPDFRPYRIVSVERQTIGALGQAVAVDYRFRIECLTSDCLLIGQRKQVGKSTTRPVHLRGVRVTARGVDGRPLTTSFPWPGFNVRSRLTDEDVNDNVPRVADGFRPARLTWTISPDLLGALGLAAASLLVLGAGWLVAGVVRSRFSDRPLRIPAHLTPIDRALALARHATERGETEEQRKALERLALELRRRGEGQLAVEAGRLAWSGEPPDGVAVEELAAAVTRATNGR